MMPYEPPESRDPLTRWFGRLVVTSAFAGTYCLLIWARALTQIAIIGWDHLW